MPHEGSRSVLPDGSRASGVLLHLTSLPGRFGIGDAGPEALRWIDALANAAQSYWQILPIGPTGCGNSPYQSPSTFALNELLVSPERFVDEGWLAASDCEAVSFPEGRTDFGGVIPFKYALLDLVWSNFQSRATADDWAAFENFCFEQAVWLDDYALFLALKAKFGDGFFWDWPEPIVRRERTAMNQLRQDLADAIERYQFRQFVTFQHWSRVHDHASERGVRLIGDLPIFVSPDSADVWSNPQVFLLDERSRPTVVAGVPPDYFSPTGQLWGSPLYDWAAQQQDGYHWWVERLRRTLRHVDVIRLDHFRGFEAAWHVPADAPNAIGGHWEPGPGADFFRQIQQTLGSLPVIAEDLGHITDEVRSLRDDFLLPGMRVLQFAFDGDPNNQFLPHRYVPNCVAYTGTHDNDTTRGWYESLSEHTRHQVDSYLRLPPHERHDATWHLIREAMESVAALTVFPLQDILNLGTEARMNVPGIADGNWNWRVTSDMPVQESLARLAELTRRTDRAR